MLLTGEAWWLAAFLAVIVRLDRYLHLSTFLSQPLVSGLLAGALFNEWQAGLTAGLLVQAAWLHQCLDTATPPRYSAKNSIFRRVGLTDQPDATSAGAVAGLLNAALVSAGRPVGLSLAYALFVAWLTGALGAIVNRLHLAINDRTVSLADLYATRGEAKEFSRIVFLDLIHHAVAGLVIIWIPARLGLFLWSFVEIIAANRIDPTARFVGEALIGYGIVTLARWFVTGRRGFAFAMPIVAAAAYVLIINMMGEL